MHLFKQNKIYPSAWVEIDLNAVRHNIREMKKFASKDKFSLPTRRSRKKVIYSRQGILAVVKADAYGHGMERVAKVLDEEKVDYFGVFHVSEGLRLRKAGIKTPILLLESSLESNIKAIVDHKLTPTIGTLDFAKKLNEYGLKKKKNVKIHVKADTGMGRLGVPYDTAFDFINEVHKLKNLTIYGIYTHFPVADTDRAFTQKQIKMLYDLVIRLDRSGLVIPYVHASNSMGLSGYRTNIINLSRPGLMIYGLYPANKLRNKVNIKPVMSVKSRISFIKTIKKGGGVSYGRTFVAKKDTLVAIVPIGYSDGYLRSFSNKASVLIKGIKCPVIGNVTMNQIIVDVTKLNRAWIGDEVVILGPQKRLTLSADDLAKLADTINYEIVCSLGSRMERVFK